MPRWGCVGPHVDQQHALRLDRWSSSCAHPQTRPLPAEPGLRGRLVPAATPTPRRPLLRRRTSIRLRAARRRDPGFDETRWRADRSADRAAAARSACAACRRWWSRRCCSGCSNGAGSTGPHQGGRPAGRGGRAAPPAGRLPGRLHPTGRCEPGVHRGGPRADRATPAGPCPPRRPNRSRTCGTWRCSGTRAPCRSPASPSPGCGKRRSGGPPTICPDAGCGPGGGPASGLSVRHHIGCAGPAVGVAADAPRPRRAPGGVGPRRHGGVPAPAGVPGIGRADQRRRPDPGLPRGPRRADPDPRDRADPPGRGRRRASARTSPSASPTSRSNPNPAETGRDLPAGDHAADLRPPGRADLTGDAHRGRAGHRHRPPPGGDLRPGLRLPGPRRRRAAGAGLRQPQGQPARPAAADQRAHRRGDHRRSSSASAARYPHTPVGELKLLPTDRRNPDGARAITAFSLSFAHRVWVDRHAGAAHRRRHRVRQDPDRALRLPAHLRPTPRRRRRPASTCCAS